MTALRRIGMISAPLVCLAAVVWAEQSPDQLKTAKDSEASSAENPKESNGASENVSQEGGAAASSKSRIHWSERPEFTPGTEVALVRFIRFTTPEGRRVPAKMFLLEIHPERVRKPDAGRPVIPQRMACLGFEIDDEPSFKPDFEVPDRYVKLMPNGLYKVSLGAVECFVRTEPPKDK